MLKVQLSHVSFLIDMIRVQVYSIREAAANNLKRLADAFGPEWALQHIIPQVHVSLLGAMAASKSSSILGRLAQTKDLCLTL